MPKISYKCFLLALPFSLYTGLGLAQPDAARDPAWLSGWCVAPRGRDAFTSRSLQRLVGAQNRRAEYQPRPNYSPLPLFLSAPSPKLGSLERRLPVDCTSISLEGEYRVANRRDSCDHYGNDDKDEKIQKQRPRSAFNVTADLCT